MGETFQELFAQGYKARRENRIADSRAIFIKAVRNAAEEGDRPSLAEALCGLGQAERDIGNLQAARLHYAGAATLYREIGPPGETGIRAPARSGPAPGRMPFRGSRTALSGSCEYLPGARRGGRARPGKYSARASFGRRIIGQDGRPEIALARGAPIICEVQGGGRRCGM